MVITIWVVAEIYTKGSGYAFGGIFGSEEAAAKSEPFQTVPQRAGERVERAHSEHEARYEKLLPE